jgi:hypothetical protein
MKSIPRYARDISFRRSEEFDRIYLLLEKMNIRQACSPHLSTFIAYYGVSEIIDFLDFVIVSCFEKYKNNVSGGWICYRPQVKGAYSFVCDQKS